MACSKWRREGGRSHTTREKSFFFSNIEFVTQNEGCDYGTFARALNVVVLSDLPSKFHKLASLSVFISHVLDAHVRGVSRHAVRAPVHMLTVVVRQPHCAALIAEA